MLDGGVLGRLSKAAANAKRKFMKDQPALRRKTQDRYNIIDPSSSGHIDGVTVSQDVEIDQDSVEQRASLIQGQYAT